MPSSHLAAPDVRDGSVLHDVAIDIQPRLLSRQSFATKDDRGGAGGDPAKTRDTPSATKPDGLQLIEQRTEQGYRDGFAAGQQEGRASGAQQGYQDGLERGKQDARDAAEKLVRQEMEDAHRSVQERVALLDQLIDALPGQIALRLHAVEDDMVALCHQIVCRILGERLVSAEGVAHLVRQAIDLTHGEASSHASQKPLVAIHLHSRDLEKLQGDEQAMTLLARRLATTSNAVPLVGDDSVGIGGCVVHSHGGSLDARLATQMASLAGVLTQETTR
ncbi:FliH/SctL family protein [Paraburkholderia acidicola]|nr:FliH/SctL family protein [Paraburkholderia acidicola]